MMILSIWVKDFDNSVLDLVKQKGFYLMSIWAILKSWNNKYQAKISFIVCWWVKILVTKNVNMFLRFGTNLKWKLWKIITIWFWNVLLLADFFEKLRNNSLKNYRLCRLTVFCEIFRMRNNLTKYFAIYGMVY